MWLSTAETAVQVAYFEKYVQTINLTFDSEEKFSRFWVFRII